MAFIFNTEYDWNRKDDQTGSSPSYIYYGYSKNTTDSDSDYTWAIKYVSADTHAYWNTGTPLMYNARWDERVSYFISPITHSLVLNVTHSVTEFSNTGNITVNWDRIPGVINYKVKVMNEDETVLYKSRGQAISLYSYPDNVTDSKAVNADYPDVKIGSTILDLQAGLTYSVVVFGENSIGATVSTQQNIYLI